MGYTVEMFLIGVDYSTDPKKVGLAGGRLNGDSLEVEFAECPGTHADVEKQIVAWINQEKKNGGVLIAIDAPLGWPKSLSKHLCRHKAGRALSAPAGRMFMRETDLCVREEIGQKPLEVGADKIARTAHKALSFLDNLRNKTGHKIPLAWKPGCVKVVSVIEVYPAATLKARGFPFEGYKNSEHAENVRAKIIERLESEMALHENVKDETRGNDDVLDAVVCVLAAKDFAEYDSRVISPEEAGVGRKRAKKEGWIWVKKP